jgi:hypothetical protein
VWDLEGGTGAEVAGPTTVSEFHDEDQRAEYPWEGDGKGTVVFDERRIISAGVGGVQVRRFDV